MSRTHGTQCCAFRFLRPPSRNNGLRAAHLGQKRTHPPERRLLPEKRATEFLEPPELHRVHADQVGQVAGEFQSIEVGFLTGGHFFLRVGEVGKFLLHGGQPVADRQAEHLGDRQSVGFCQGANHSLRFVAERDGKRLCGRFAFVERSVIHLLGEIL